MAKKIKIAHLDKEHASSFHSQEYVRRPPQITALKGYFDTRASAQRMIREKGIAGREYELILIHTPNKQSDEPNRSTRLQV